MRTWRSCPPPRGTGSADRASARCPPRGARSRLRLRERGVDRLERVEDLGRSDRERREEHEYIFMEPAGEGQDPPREKPRDQAAEDLGGRLLAFAIPHQLDRAEEA